MTSTPTSLTGTSTACSAVVPLFVIAEYVAALDDFQPGESTFDGQRAAPSAFDIEAGYHLMLAGKGAISAIACRGTDQAVALELPEKPVLVALSVEVMEGRMGARR